MKKILFIIPAFFIALSCLIAQETDKKSKTILDDLAAKFKSYNTLKVDFSYTMKNKQENIDETIKGILYIKKEKYRLELPEQIIICDGKSVWTILKEVNEIHISTVEESEDVITPQNIYSIYEKGHRSKHIREGEEKGKKVHVIELVPNESKEYHKVRLNIEKETNMLVSAVIFDRNGTTFTYDLVKTQPNVTIADDKFAFNASTYSKFEIIDLR